MAVLASQSRYWSHSHGTGLTTRTHTHTRVPYPLYPMAPYPHTPAPLPTTRHPPPHHTGVPDMHGTWLAVHQASFGLKTRGYMGHPVSIFGIQWKSDKTRLHSNRTLQKPRVFDTFPHFSSLFASFRHFCSRIRKMGHWAWGQGVQLCKTDRKTVSFLLNREQKDTALAPCCTFLEKNIENSGFGTV